MLHDQGRYQQAAEGCRPSPRWARLPTCSRGGCGSGRRQVGAAFFSVAVGAPGRAGWREGIEDAWHPARPGGARNIRAWCFVSRVGALLDGAVQMSSSPPPGLFGSGGEPEETEGEREEALRLSQSLIGAVLPPLLLPAPRGDSVDLGMFAKRSVVIYAYPGSGSSPDGRRYSRRLDRAQHRAFDLLGSDFSALNITVLGVSGQYAQEQDPRNEELRPKHPLLSDPYLLLADALGLPTFEHEGSRLYRRVTIVVWLGRIGKVFYPVADPVRNPAHVAAWARVQGP